MANSSGEISLEVRVELVFSGDFPLTLHAVTDKKVLLGLNDDPQGKDGGQACGTADRGMETYMIRGTLETTYSNLAFQRPHKYSSFDMSTNIPHEDEKIDPQGDFSHVESRFPESKQDAADHAYAQGQVETGYEGLSIIATIKHFKVAFLVCFAATFAAATDGYQSRQIPLILASQADSSSRYQW